VEILLNITWAVCSLILIRFWMRRGISKPIPRHTQFLALGMTLLLLLPVISLSDDLLAMQAPAETDTCVRRVQQSDNLHPVNWPLASAQPPSIYLPALIGLVAMQLPPREERAVPPDTVLFFIENRPPPHA
jgi:hypothetical protein